MGYRLPPGFKMPFAASIYEDENGTPHILDAGVPMLVEEVEEVLRICQKFLSMYNSQEALQNQKDFVAMKYPGMYEQMYDDALPAKAKKGGMVCKKKK